MRDRLRAFRRDVHFLLDLRHLSWRVAVCWCPTTVLSRTYRYPGSEIELLELGLVRAGALDGLKSRVLLSLCLAADLSRAQIAEAFESLAVSSPAVASRPPRPVAVGTT